MPKVFEAIIFQSFDVSVRPLYKQVLQAWAPAVKKVLLLHLKGRHAKEHHVKPQFYQISSEIRIFKFHMNTLAKTFYKNVKVTLPHSG